MSSARQTVTRGPNFMGLGKRPSLIPAHQVDLLTGIGPRGDKICLSRTKPVEGKSWSVIVHLRPVMGREMFHHPLCLLGKE